MKFFYLSSKPNKSGHFVVHDKECELIPDSLERDYLGPFNNGREALRKALQMKSDAVCCENCCITSSQTVFISAKSNKV